MHNEEGKKKVTQTRISTPTMGVETDGGKENPSHKGIGSKTNWKPTDNGDHERIGFCLALTCLTWQEINYTVPNKGQHKPGQGIRHYLECFTFPLY